MSGPWNFFPNYQAAGNRQGEIYGNAQLQNTKTFSEGFGQIVQALAQLAAQKRQDELMKGLYTSQTTPIDIAGLSTGGQQGGIPQFNGQVPVGARNPQVFSPQPLPTTQQFDPSKLFEYIISGNKDKQDVGQRAYAGLEAQAKIQKMLNPTDTSRQPYEDFAQKYPQTPQGKNQAATDWADAQLGVYRKKNEITVGGQKDVAGFKVGLETDKPTVKLVPNEKGQNFFVVYDPKTKTSFNVDTGIKGTPKGDGASTPITNKMGETTGWVNPSTGKVVTTKELGLGDSIGGTLTSTTRTMVEAAPQVKGLIDEIRPIIEANRGGLGPVGSRWQEFMAGKVGAPNEQYTKLRTNTELLQTMLMRMHVGSRGGQYIMEKFQNLIDQGKQSPENMIAALDEIQNYADRVASEGGGGTEKKYKTIKLRSGKTIQQEIQ